MQNSQALQYDQMHAALQSARNQSSLETPLKAEELLTAHFNLAILEDQTVKHTSTDAEKFPDNTQNADPSTSDLTTRLTSRYRVATLRIVLQGDRTLQEQLPLPADTNTDLLTPYLRVMSLMTLGTICLIHMTTHTRTT